MNTTVNVVTELVPSLHKVKLDEYHAYIWFRKEGGRTDFMLEAVAQVIDEKRVLEPYGFGYLMKKKFYKRDNTVGADVSQIVNPFGNDETGYHKLQNRMLTYFENYHNTTPYWPAPPFPPNSANSNSFVGTLLRRSGVNASGVFSTTYGWSRDAF